MEKMIQLTKNIKVNSSAHILYLYDEIDNYLNNMIAYIKSGLDRNHHLIIIENTTIYTILEERLKKLLSIEEMKSIQHVDNKVFYRRYGDFHIHSILKNFGKLLEPYFNKKINVRTWAHVEWNDQNDISNIIEDYEHSADCCVNNMRLMSVCAYNSSKLNAKLQTSMMKSHEYLMTDLEFVQSSLYKKIKKIG